MARPSKTGGKTSAAKTRKAGSVKGRNPGKTKRRIAPAAIRLERSPVSCLGKELKEAREQQAATAEILNVIASSPDDVQPVFDAIATRATRLIGGFSCAVFRLVDGMAHLGAFTPTTPQADEVLKSNFPRPVAEVALFQMVQAGKVMQIPDTEALTDEMRDIARARGYRSILFAPLMNKDVSIGFIAVTRIQAGSFADHHVQLLRTFADQAVIAIENVRLFDEVQARTHDLTEALQQQSATADVLKVISRSTFDLHAVLQTLVDSAAQLSDADKAFITRQRDGAFYRAEAYGLSSEVMEFVQDVPIKPERGTAAGRALLERHVVHISDVTVDPEYTWVQAQRLGDFRTILAVPMLRERTPVGVLILVRSDVRPFTDKQIELVTTFADQAVIAIENARLFEEVQAKTRDLEESLQQQTATSEVLQIISSSPGDLAPVFDKMLENAVRVCGAEFGSMNLVEDDSVRQAALYNVPAALAAARTNKISRPHPQSTLATAIRSRQVVHVADLRTTPAYLERSQTTVELVELGGARTVAVVPMLRDHEVIGVITVYRQEVQLFDDKQIELLSNFAKQAVIAIENTRLLTEQQEALERQTATADVLRVINSSPGDLTPVFQAMLEKATRLCGSGFGTLWLYDGERFSVAATHAVPATLDEFVREPVPVAASASLVDIVRGQNVVHVPDLAATDLYHAGNRVRRAYVDLGGARTLISVALRKDNALLGAFNVYRQEVRPFFDKEIALVENFAAQAVIAIENARLLGELRQRTADLARSVDELAATGDVLKIISRSFVELETVLDTLVEKVARLCRADQAFMFRSRNDMYHLVASQGLSREAKAFFGTHPVTQDRGALTGRVILERRAVHIPDVLSDPEYTYQAQKIAGYRTMLGVPLLRGDELIGTFSLHRTRVEPFTDKEIELATTFADQAVIAIENARLFEELRDRQAELRVTFDNMGDGVRGATYRVEPQFPAND